eukprot:scaffold33258_cov62-Phaeocystis_antarctica.AAC.7
MKAKTMCGRPRSDQTVNAQLCSAKFTSPPRAAAAATPAVRPACRPAHATQGRNLASYPGVG